MITWEQLPLAWAAPTWLFSSRISFTIKGNKLSTLIFFPETLFESRICFEFLSKNRKSKWKDSSILFPHRRASFDPSDRTQTALGRVLLIFSSEAAEANDVRPDARANGDWARANGRADDDALVVSLAEQRHLLGLL